MSPLAAQLLAALPQTQCTRCGFPDCAAYAQSIADGAAGIDQCPPGGAEGIARLAAITGETIIPLNPAYGVEGPRTVAIIDENWCIGCTLCIQACPTDAIVGANKSMHTVIEPYCTGCALCLPPCPVDCIQMVEASGGATGWAAWSDEQAAQARTRYERHTKRLAANPQTTHSAESQAVQTGPYATDGTPPTPTSAAEKKQAAAQAALARARAKRAAATQP